MKKCIKIIIIGVIVSCLMIGNVFAFSKTTDYEENVIGLPSSIWNGKGTITVSNTITNYHLYYQAIEVPNGGNDIKKYVEDENNKLEEKYENVKTLRDETQTALTEYNNKVKAYNELAASGASEEELTTAEEAANTAKDAYDKKRAEYDEAYEEYINSVKAMQNTFFDKAPQYVDSNWKETTDGSFEIDTSTYTGDRAYALWVKLVTSDNNEIYDMNVYTATGTKASTSSGSENTVEDPVETKKEDGKKEDPTVAKDPIPQTGQSIIIIAGITISIISAIILIKKNKEYKEI